MVDDLDIYCAARLPIDQHGDEAAIRAAERADAMLERGDLDGAATWRRILGAVKKLQNTEPAGPVH